MGEMVDETVDVAADQGEGPVNGDAESGHSVIGDGGVDRPVNGASEEETRCSVNGESGEEAERPVTGELVTGLELRGTEKRYNPSKHYVYILLITWSDGAQKTIYRKYSDFYDLHVTLLDTFPEEAGYTDDKQRTIPLLPGKRCRSEVQKVASKRLASLGEYFEALTAMPTRVTASDVMIDFFRSQPDDLNPPPNRTVKPEKSGLLYALLPFMAPRKKAKPKLKRSASLSSISTPDPCEHAPDISSPLSLPRYTAVADFDTDKRNEVTLREGQVLEVVEKHDNGWWFVQSEGGEQGWCPASFLESTDGGPDEHEPPPLATCESYVARCGYDKLLDDELSFPAAARLDVIHKLLDGWWIALYRGEVGYVPATFLRPSKDSAHLSTKTIRRPTQRRCTIKTRRKSSVKTTTSADLEMYRQLSVRMKRQERPALTSMTAEPVSYENVPREADIVFDPYEVMRDDERPYENIDDDDDDDDEREEACSDYINMGDQEFRRPVIDEIGGYANVTTNQPIETKPRPPAAMATRRPPINNGLVQSHISKLESRSSGEKREEDQTSCTYYMCMDKLQQMTKAIVAGKGRQPRGAKKKSAIAAKIAIFEKP